jgi:UDP-N-acetylglucosamine 2-epimerase (non-hydrolysing)
MRTYQIIIGCSLVASKLHIMFAHVEAGLRSFDRTMPEVINRLVIDTLSDLLFVSEKRGLQNLKNEGISSWKVHFIVNCMIDSLIHFIDKTNKSDILTTLGVQPANYIPVTLHHPSNVDVKENFRNILVPLKKFRGKS